MKSSFYLIAGLGKTGLSIARYLQRKQHTFLAFDTRLEPPELFSFLKEFPNAQFYGEHFPDELLPDITEIITSPGVSLDLPLFKKAREYKIPIYGDIECLARDISVPIIGITGTNGKSTVTTLVGEMAKSAGIKVAVAGNIGTPVLDELAKNIADLWVLELSSFQLDLTISLRPKAATILNISPDHLDRHHSMEAYIASKHRIYTADTVIFNRDDPATYPMTQVAHKVLSFGKDRPLSEDDWGLLSTNGQVYLAQGQQQLLAVNDLKIKGMHNWYNALAACALAATIPVSFDVMKKVLTSFTGLNHRCQWVRSLAGIDWINDSKGTNIGATISAIQGLGGSMQGKIVLIAGGQGKGADFKELQPAIKDFVRSVILIGEDADKIEASLKHLVPITRTTSLEEAVILAKGKAQAGDVVLLSPACASQDMFRDYNHRGEVFVASVMGL